MSTPARDANEIELFEWQFSSSPRGSFYSLATVDADQEREPLISSSSSSVAPIPATPRAVRHSTRTAGANLSPIETNHLLRREAQFNEVNEEPYCFDAIMEKLKDSKFSYWANKLAVKSEPGLTTTQLMLTNFDLKPVEPERRQWGAWNFVGFWIGMAS